MKKFMKAIAFATVMCLLLSTVAFAANEDVVVNTAAKKVTVTVEDVAAGEQVALVITKGDAADYTFNSTTILYVDQKAAGSSTAVFENIAITDETVEAIDVYAGYATNAGANAVKVANDIPLSEEVVVVTLVNATVIDDVTAQPEYDEATMGTPDEGTKGSVVYLQLNVTGVAAGELTQMFWAFHVTKDGEAGTDTKYAAGDVAQLGLGTALQGNVEIAAAFESTGYTVTGANAIFLINGDDYHTAEEETLADIIADNE